MATRESNGRIMSVKVGEVPLFYDNTNPRLYRRKLCDWVAFQDLGDDSGGKKLTRGQQILAIVTNIRGNAGLRMSHIPSMLSKDMTRQDFMKVVDHILDIVDPLDKESSFLQTAKAWRDLMCETHHKNQSYDRFWTEFSSLCLNYAYCHGESAQTPGVQELLALLCILNAHLPRAEFGIVLQSAMQFQKEKQRLIGVGAPLVQRGTHMIGPASATRAMSYYSDAAGDTGAATAISGDQATVAADTGDGAGGTTVGALGAALGTQPQSGNTEGLRKHSRVFEKTRLIELEIRELLRRESEMENEIGAAMAAVAGVEASNADPARVQAITGAFQTLRVKNNLNNTSAGSIRDLNEDLITMADENSVAYSTALPTRVSVQTQDRAGSTRSRIDPPLISLEAVRMALRRIDHGDKAMKPSGSENYTSRESPLRRANLTKAGQATKKGPSASSASNKAAAVGPHIECYVCRGNHFYYQKVECKEQYESRRRAPRGARGRTVAWKESAEESKPPAPPAAAGSRPGRSGQRAASALSSPLWADGGRAAFTKMSSGEMNPDDSSSELMSAIVDGGASNTVIGLQYYVQLCDEQGVPCNITELRSDDFRFHAFGTTKNHSELEEVVGRCAIPLPVGSGKFVFISALVVDGDVPFVIGKDSLKEHGCLESHDGDWVEFDTDRGRVRIALFVSPHDGHARIRMHQEDMLANAVEGMLQASTGTTTNDNDLIRRIHSRTHLHPKSVETLLKRANKWTPSMRAEIAEVQEQCWICLRSGDPPPARKFSLSRLDAQFNGKVYVDVFYWDSKMILHVVDYATGHSEMGLIESRNMEQILRTIQNIWILRHGDPVALYADAEFERSRLLPLVVITRFVLFALFLFCLV